jgi:hypothetical protein
MYRTLTLAIEAQHTVLRVFDNGLLSFFIQPDDIHGAGVDTYPAPDAKLMVNPLNTHSS